MNTLQKRTISTVFVQENMKQSAMQMLSFIDLESLEKLYETIKEGYQFTASNQLKPFMNLLISYLLQKKYMNKVDRSMFYFFYENEISSNIDNMAVENFKQIYNTEAQQIYLNFQILFNRLQRYCNMSTQETESLKAIITEPDLPLPVSIRSNLGKYCNSIYQMFICSKAYGADLALEIESKFETFKSYVAQNEQKYIKSIILSTKNSNSIKKLKQLLTSPENFIRSITFTESDYIEGNELYNFILIVLQLSKNILEAYKYQLKSLSNDPYAKFMELLLRFSLFKSFVIQLEEEVGSIFKIFGEMLEDLFGVKIGNSNDIKFVSWKILFQLFFQKMESELYQSIPVYINLLHKLKQQNSNQLYEKLSISSSNFVEKLSQYQNSPVLNYLMSEQIDNLPSYLSDFIEMFVDLSVDESNILWSGHSEQNMGKAYQMFQSELIDYEKDIFSKLQFEDEPNMSEVVSEQLRYLNETVNIKPRTLKLLSFSLNINVDYDFITINDQLSYINGKNSYEYSFTGTSKYGSVITSASENDNQSEIDFDSEEWEYVSQGQSECMDDDTIETF